MTEPQLRSVQCISPAGLHTMAYKEWGDKNNPNVLVCVHGVTRVSDDFDALARALCEQYRVICPDVVGRGRSSWLKNPQLYQLPQYIADMVTLVARLDVTSVDWCGTSMGGLIGMGLASQQGSPESRLIRKLVLNDIGPALNYHALSRIGEYIGNGVRFEHYADAEQFIRAICVPFGPHTDEQWHKIAADVLRQDQDGYWIRHYDLALAHTFNNATPESIQQGEHLLWGAYDAMTCPTLLLRGVDSDLLTRETAQQMTQRGPHAHLVEFAGIGHAPTLVHTDQITVIKDFLLN